MPQLSDDTQDLHEHQAEFDQPFSNQQFTIFASHSELNLEGSRYSTPLDTSGMEENTTLYPKYLLQQNNFGQANQVIQQRAGPPGRTRTPDLDYTQFSLTNGDEAEPMHPVHNNRVHDRIWRPLGSLPTQLHEPLVQPGGLTVNYFHQQVPAHLRETAGSRPGTRTQSYAGAHETSSACIAAGDRRDHGPGVGTHLSSTLGQSLFDRRQRSLHPQVPEYLPAARSIIPSDVYLQGSVIPRISGRRRSIQIMMENRVSNIMLPVPIQHRSLQRPQSQTVSPKTERASQNQHHQRAAEVQNNYHGMYDGHGQYSQAAITSADAHTERVSASGPESASASGNHNSGPIINHLKRNPTTETEDNPKIKRRRKNEVSVDYGNAKTPLERARAVLALGLGGKPKKYCDPTQPIRCQLEAIPGYTSDERGLCGYLCADSSELIAHILASKNSAAGHRAGHGIGGSKGRKAAAAARNPEDVSICTWGNVRGCTFTRAQGSRSGMGKGKQKAIEKGSGSDAEGLSAAEMVGGNLARHIATVHALLTREQDMAIRMALKLTRIEKDALEARSEFDASPNISTGEGQGDLQAQSHHYPDSSSEFGSFIDNSAFDLDLSFNFDTGSNTYTTHSAVNDAAALDPSIDCELLFGNNMMSDFQFAPQGPWGWEWGMQHKEIQNMSENGAEDHSQHIHVPPTLAGTSGIASATEAGGSTYSLDYNSGFHKSIDLLHARNAQANFNDQARDAEEEDDHWGGLEYVD